MTLYVINKGDATHADRYDGQDYVFEPKVPVAITEPAAALMFGYGKADKTEALVRQGWLSQAASYPEAVKKFDVFAFIERDLAPPTLEDLEGTDAADAADADAAPTRRGRASA